MNTTQLETLSLEDTWTGQWPIPVDLTRDVGRLSGAERSESGSTHRATLVVDTPLSLMFNVDGYGIYWSQELTAVVVDVPATATPEDFRSAVYKATSYANEDAHAFILDLRECPDATELIKRGYLQLERLCCRVLAIHESFSAAAPLPGSGVHYFREFTAASRWVRANSSARHKGNPAVDCFGGRPDIKLIAANYVGSLYWTLRARTLMVIYSGQEGDEPGLQDFARRVRAYLNRMEALNVIIDLRNRMRTQPSETVRLQQLLEQPHPAGVEHFVIVGDKQWSADEADPVDTYHKVLRAAKVRFTAVKTLEQGLAITTRPAQGLH